MAISAGKGHASVAKASKPSASLPRNKGAAHVSSHSVQNLSSGKMASVPHVTLGTSHGNHSVVHAVNGN